MIVIFLGPPGVGKGTQCGRLSDHFQIVHVSTGDILRQAVQDGTELGKRVQTYLQQGQLVPDTVVIDLVSERLDEPDCQRGCLLDGFPRTVAQAKALDQFLQHRQRQVDHVVYLQVSPEQLGRRLLLRAEREERPDDTPQTIAQRMKVYQDETAPLLDYYQRQGKLSRIDGSPPPEAVYQAILQRLGAARG